MVFAHLDFLGKEQAESGFVLPSMPLSRLFPFSLFSFSIYLFVHSPVGVLVPVSGWKEGQGPASSTSSLSPSAFS